MCYEFCMLLSILSCPGGLWKYIKKGTCICSPFFYCTTPYNILILPSLYFKPSFEIDIKSCMPPDPCNCSTSFQSPQVLSHHSIAGFPPPAPCSCMYQIKKQTDTFAYRVKYGPGPGYLKALCTMFPSSC